MTAIKTLQKRSCNFAGADVGPGRFPTQRDVLQQPYRIMLLL